MAGRRWPHARSNPNWRGITTDMVKELNPSCRPVLQSNTVYNPLIYACASFDAYVACCDIENVEVILLGMNPGPWGMAQTGVPFGEVGAVQALAEALTRSSGSPLKEVHPSGLSLASIATAAK
ncbi:MAG: hypothetical protein R3E58_06750 [Phycisphaerae bacterium]